MATKARFPDGRPWFREEHPRTSDPWPGLTPTDVARDLELHFEVHRLRRRLEKDDAVALDDLADDFARGILGPDAERLRDRDLEMFVLDAAGGALMGCDIVECQNCQGKGRAPLTDFLQATLDLLRARGPSTAGELHAASEKRRFDRIGVTAFNNRLEQLRVVGLVTRERKGRAVVYTAKERG